MGGRSPRKTGRVVPRVSPGLRGRRRGPSLGYELAGFMASVSRFAAAGRLVGGFSIPDQLISSMIPPGCSERAPPPALRAPSPASVGGLGRGLQLWQLTEDLLHEVVMYRHISHSEITLLQLNKSFTGEQ